MVVILHMIRIIRKMISEFKNFIKICIYYFFWIFPIKKNQVIADNFIGKEIGDNTGAIVNALVDMNADVKVFWVLNKNIINNVDPEKYKKVNCVQFGSIKYLYTLATSKIWLDNVRNPFCIKKRKKQFYIQTWHGGFGFKRMEKDCEDILEKQYIKKAKNDSKNINLLITNSKWQKKYLEECFYYDGEILVSGYPRNDILIDDSKFDKIKEKVYKDLGVSKDTKLLLYAPTFRDDRSTECYNMDYERLLKVLNKKFSSKWKIIIRLHPNIADMDLFDGMKNIINVSKYPSLNDLMIASDMLISDYSTVVFDYSYLSKPILLYASDYEKYSSERGLLFTYDELPFPYAYDNDELEKVVLSYSTNKFITELKKFYKKNGLLEDGHASERIAKIIIKKVSE